jgi:hypothetical protein
MSDRGKSRNVPPRKKGNDPDQSVRLGGATRGGKHADRSGKAGTSGTASDKAGKSKHVGRPTEGKHRKGQ